MDSLASSSKTVEYPRMELNKESRIPVSKKYYATFSKPYADINVNLLPKSAKKSPGSGPEISTKKPASVGNLDATPSSEKKKEGLSISQPDINANYEYAESEDSMDDNPLLLDIDRWPIPSGMMGRSGIDSIVLADELRNYISPVPSWTHSTPSDHGLLEMVGANGVSRSILAFTFALTFGGPLLMLYYGNY